MAEIIVHKIIPVKEQPRNCYHISVTGMSGDADHNETTEYKAKSYEDALYMLVVFRAMQQWQDHGMTRITESDEAEINSLITALGFPAYKGSLSDLWMDYVGRDITNDGWTLARLSTISVTYFNDFGVEHECKFNIKVEDPFVDCFYD